MPSPPVPFAMHSRSGKRGNDVPIHMFPGVLPDALPILYANHLTPTIYNQQLADAAADVARSKWNVFIKIDAGFGRLGVPLEDAEAFVLSVAKKPNLAIEGIFTHLPFAGEAALGWVNDRLHRFDDLVARIRRRGLEIPIRQSLASSGVIKGLSTASNTVCVGHLLFGGLGRFGPDDTIASQFEPVHKTIRTRIIDARRYTSDVMVGSGGKLSLKSGAMLGTVPLGLHEGYRAGAAGCQPFMLIDGVMAPVVSVSQEYSVLDISSHSQVSVGDEVIALGSSGDIRITIEEMAAWQGRTPLQVVMSMDRAIPKHYLSAH